MSEEQEANALQEALVRAATDPAARPEFYRELLRSTLYVLTPEPPARDGPETLASDATFSLVVFEGPGGPFVPIFSSRARLDEVAHQLGRPFGFVALEGHALFGVLAQNPNEAVLDPGFPYGKQFVPAEIRGLADGTWSGGEQRVLGRETQVLLGQPAEYPRALVDALVRLFRQRPSVEAAYLAQIHFPDEPAPHPVVGLRSSDYAKDSADAGLVAREVGAPLPVDFVDVSRDPDDALSRYLCDRTEPFYAGAQRSQGS